MSDQIALMFYDDHYSKDFLEFQRLYLDNLWTKFLKKHGYIPSFEEWKTGEYSDFDTYDCDEYLVSEDEEEDLLKEGEDSVPDNIKETAVKLIEKFTKWGLDVPTKLKESPEKITSIEMHFLMGYCWYCEAKIVAAVDKSKKLTDSGSEIFNDQELGVMIHKRYNGSVLLKGFIGEKKVVFSYHPSCKWEMPCCADEILLSRKNEGDKAAWGCRKGVVISGSVLRLDKKGSEFNLDRRHERKYYYAESIGDIEYALQMQPLPDKFLVVLNQIFNN